jgi:thiamine-monophosphate kinase
MPPGQLLVRDTGEFDLLRSLLPTLEKGEQVLVGPGDDAAVLDVSSPVLLCTDVLTEDVHFRRDWSTAHDVGRKAVAVNAADIAAMGGRTRALTVGLVLPADTEVAWVEQLTGGLRAEAEAVGCSIVGGDTVAGPVVVISVTALGSVDGPALTRSGAQPGDVLAVSGRLGHAAAGLDVLRRGFRSPRALVDAHRCPQPPYDDGPVAARRGATAMIDISDGLLADVGHLARASGVGVAIDADAVGVDDELTAMGRGLGVDPRSWVLTGGEDHALAATFPAAVTLPSGFRAIGAVTDGSGVTVTGVELAGQSAGYEHFSG